MVLIRTTNPKSPFDAPEVLRRKCTREALGRDSFERKIQIIQQKELNYQIISACDIAEKRRVSAGNDGALTRLCLLNK